MMELTENNRAEIRLIAQEVVKEQGINFKQDLQDFKKDLKEMLSTHNESLDHRLSLQRELDTANNELRFKTIETVMVTDKQVWWICGKFLGGVSVFAGLIISVLAIIFSK